MIPSRKQKIPSNGKLPTCDMPAATWWCHSCGHRGGIEGPTTFILPRHTKPACCVEPSWLCSHRRGCLSSCVEFLMSKSKLCRWQVREKLSTSWPSALTESFYLLPGFINKQHGAFAWLVLKPASGNTVNSLGDVSLNWGSCVLRGKKVTFF